MLQRFQYICCRTEHDIASHTGMEIYIQICMNLFYQLGAFQCVSSREKMNTDMFRKWAVFTPPYFFHYKNYSVVSGQIKRWTDTLKWFIGSKFRNYGMISKVIKHGLITVRSAIEQRGL